MNEEKNLYKNWADLESSCGLIFGDRFSVSGNELTFKFDHRDPAQLHESETLHSGLLNYKIKHEMSIEEHEESGNIFVPDLTKPVTIVVSKNNITSFLLEKILHPVLHQSMLIDGENRVLGQRLHHDPTIEYLSHITERPWSLEMPSDYTDWEGVYTLSNAREVDPKLREQQETQLAKAFLPSWRRPELKASEWIEHQKNVEREGNKPTKVCMPSSIATAVGNRRPKEFEKQGLWKHQETVLSDPHFIKETKDIFSR